MTAKKADDLTKAENLFLNGASIHQVLLGCKSLSWDDALAIQKEVAEGVKHEVIGHKILIRSNLRMVIPTAINVLRQYLSPSGNPFTEELETPEGRQKAALRMRAAQIILQASKVALDDPLLTLLSEKPSEGDRVQDTLFDFAAEIDDQGATRLVVKTGETING